jgi:D-alanine--poly(phosphoribitol) ligase subunit 1
VLIVDLLATLDEYKESDSIVHIYRDGIMKYSELLQKSDALASYLIEHYGWDKAPIVAYGHKQHEMIISFLGCVKAGHAYIPVDSSQPYERVKDIIESSGAQIVLSISHLDWPEGQIAIINKARFDKLIHDNAGKEPDQRYRVKKNDNFYILYTSGSTGKPKGVRITLGCLEGFLEWALKMTGAEEGRIYLNQCSYSFDVSMMVVYLSLITGSSLFSIDREMIANMHELFEYFKSSGINIWISTPSFMEMCVADSHFNKELLPELGLFLFAGEILPNECVKKLYQQFGDVRIVNAYGPTETTILVTAIDISQEMCEKKGALPLGYAMDNCLINIVDDHGRVLPDGEKGEVVIVGETVSPGYLNNEELTARVFSRVSVNGVDRRSYQTGDVGYLKDGVLFYCGRKDNQIKISGYRIEIEDIENNLRKLDIVENAVVLPVMADGKARYLVAVVLLSRKLEEREFKIGLLIKDQLKAWLPEYMIPRKIVIRDSFPMTVNGKVDRKKLAEELE